MKIFGRFLLYSFTFDLCLGTSWKQSGAAVKIAKEPVTIQTERLLWQCSVTSVTLNYWNIVSPNKGKSGPQAILPFLQLLWITGVTWDHKSNSQLAEFNTNIKLSKMHFLTGKRCFWHKYAQARLNDEKSVFLKQQKGKKAESVKSVNGKS